MLILMLMLEKEFGIGLKQSINMSLTKCYVKVSGGLGNQLFQIATGLAYAKRTNKIFKILLSKDNPRGFHWNETLKDYQQYIVDKTENVNIITYKEPCFNYREIPDFKQSVILEGYFQSSKYFPRLNLEIHVEPREKLSENCVIVHARRGDYCSNSWMISYHNPQPDSYYERARDHMNMNIENVRYILLSDDPRYWRSSKVFEDCDHQIIDENMYDTLSILTSGNNFIMSNSTFAWWGVYLSKNKGITVAPKEWFGPSFREKWNSIYEDTWTLF